MKIAKLLCVFMFLCGYVMASETLYFNDFDGNELVTNNVLADWSSVGTVESVGGYSSYDGFGGLFLRKIRRL